MKIQDYTIDDDYWVDLRKILSLELQFKDVFLSPKPRDKEYCIVPKIWVDIPMDADCVE